MRFLVYFLAVLLAREYANASCISSGNEATINNALSAGGQGAIVQLCAGVTLELTGSISFTADNQEISTQGYPTGSTRAILQIATGTQFSTLISGAGKNGIRILNIQVDGNRPNAGYINGGGANIEIGGTSNGQVVKYVNSRNPRGWSCLHVTEGGLTSNYCSNATIANNDIGPCGQSGTNSAGQGLWADGISFACTDSLVESNTITGSTDGGIVLFGAPGTTVTGNTLTSSSTYLGFGAINLVDGTYHGQFTNVQVTNNKIIGDYIFAAGISIGACVWSGPCKSPYIYTGPATITGNTFSGRVAFPIAINGWTNGLTVTGNSVSAVTTPLSSYASDSGCSSVVKTLFSNNDLLTYYPAGLTGTYSLQSGFVAMSGNGTDFICPVATIAAPTSATAPPTSTKPTSTTPSSGQTCIAGTGPGNYLGLCSFCCNYGYCPGSDGTAGPCTCTQHGAPIPTPPVTGTNGVPLTNEDNTYLGLCSFACNHGYCPSTACMVV